MKRFIIFLLPMFLLVGCARHESPAITMLDAANHSLDSIEASLKPECKTPSVTSDISAVRLQILSAKREFADEISDLNAALNRWRLCVSVFVGIIVVFFLWAIKK